MLQNLETSAAIRLGTSSWSFDGWRGVFYPTGLARNEYLTFYARQFCSVEVNTSFYAVPEPTTLIDWVESVPPGFTFSLKFPRRISHELRLTECRRETLVFLDAARSLGSAAGPVFLQLPPDMTRARYGKTLSEYLDWLAEQAGRLRIAVEVRAADLMTAAFACFLAQRNMALALVDRVGSADLYDLWMEQLDAGLAPKFVMARWIGDDRNGPKGDRELTAPRELDLDRWAGRLVQLQEAGVEVFGYMHNPYEGHAPASVRRLQERLARKLALPAWPPPETGDMQAQMSLFAE
jgi:uncharacterized protein YecE (DUF72 family)